MIQLKKPPFIVLLLLISFGSISSSLIAPALPSIKECFQIEASYAKASVTIFLFGYALGQLIYGPLGNYWGRIKALRLGVAIAIAGSLLSLISFYFHLYEFFLLSRFIMALGSCVGLMMILTLVNECYSMDRARAVISYLFAAFAVMPGVASAIGGFFITYMHWISCFCFLTGYGILLFFLCNTLPETAVKLDRSAIQWKTLLRNYYRILKDKNLISCSLLVGGATACDYIFTAISPFIGISLIGLKPATYGVYFFLPVGGIVIGSLVSSRIAAFCDAKPTIFIGLLIAFISAASMTCLFYFGWINEWTLFFPVIFLFFGLALIYSSAAVLSTANIDDKSNGSGMLSFINLTVAAIAVNIASLYDHPFFLPLSLLILVGLMGIPWQQVTSCLTYTET